MVHVTQVLWPVTRPLTQWAREMAQGSQRHACRNAMVASTAITATRRERDEVQEYVDALIAHRAGGSSAPLPASALG